MKIKIIGNGAFGSFLAELFKPHIELADDANIVILAIPHHAYAEVADVHKDRHLVNVCSIQSTTTNILWKRTSKITSIHPLFGSRTPADKRNAICTFRCDQSPEVIDLFQKVCNVLCTYTVMVPELGSTKLIPIQKPFTPEYHDKLMARTHLRALHIAKSIAPLVKEADDIPDELIPNSFRLLRQFVKTLEDMPLGTVESIMANPYEGI